VTRQLSGTTIEIPSSLDGALQHVRYQKAAGENRPLVAALHTWSHDYTQDIFDQYAECCRTRDWHLIFPDFRGQNMNSAACASELAAADVLDAVSWARETFSVDHRRIFLAGMSGGGHMSLFMASKYPSVWTAVSAWVPISDLARWHGETAARNLTYTSDMEAVCGGAPGSSSSADSQYFRRSSIGSLWRAHIVPMDINAGIHDGHQGNSVPVGQSIRAFNELAKYVEDYEQMVGEDAIAVIEEEERVPDWCDRGSTNDSTCTRDIHLRRTSKLARLTIFEGGHEILYDTAFAWFDKF
jgi:acetyl esterase/lipase